MNEACEARIDALSDRLEADKNDRAAAHELNFILTRFFSDHPGDTRPDYTPEHYELHVNGRRTFRG